MKLINKTNKQKKGFSLIELLAVLGVGGAMVAGALMLVSDVQSKRDIKTNSENISAIFNNMQTVFANEPIDVSNFANLYAAGIIPSSMKNSGSTTSPTIRTPGGGEISFAAAGDEGYTLKYPKVSSDSCVEIISNQKNVGWDGYAVTNGIASADDSDTSFTGVSFTTIASACNTEDDWVSLTFTYGEEVSSGT